MAIRTDIIVNDKGTPVVRKFDKNVKKSSKSVEKSTSSMEKGFSQLKNVLTGVVSAYSVGAIARFTTATLRQIDSVGKLSLRLGETTEFLSQMAFAAEQSGVAVQGMNVGIQRANRRLAEFAATGKGSAAPAIKALGLEVKNADGTVKSFEQILPDIADGLNKVKSESEKVRLAFQLFDTEGVSLVQLLKSGSKGIEALRKEANELGRTLTQEMTDKAAIAGDAINKLTSTITGLGNQMAVSLAPSLIKASDGMRKIIKDAENTNIVVSLIKNLSIQTLEMVGATDVAANAQKRWNSQLEKANIEVTGLRNAEQAVVDLNKNFASGFGLQKAVKEVKVIADTEERTTKELALQFDLRQKQLVISGKMSQATLDEQRNIEDKIRLLIEVQNLQNSKVQEMNNRFQDATNIIQGVASAVSQIGVSLDKFNFGNFIDLIAGVLAALPGPLQPFAQGFVAVRGFTDIGGGGGGPNIGGSAGGGQQVNNSNLNVTVNPVFNVGQTTSKTAIRQLMRDVNTEVNRGVQTLNANSLRSTKQ